MAYDRPWRSFDEQLALFKTRGMCVTNDQAAKNYLERVGYYRLSGYWYPFRQFVFLKDPSTGSFSAKALDQFHPNTHFSDAVKLYLFDKVELSLLFTYKNAEKSRRSFLFFKYYLFRLISLCYQLHY